MNRQIIGIAFACLAGCSLWGCGRAAQVNNPTESQTASKPMANTEPGPKDADAATEFTTTASGLKYRILRKGNGTKPTRSNQVLVNYKGWLDDGTVFDQSYGREPFTFSLAGGVIDGWLEGATYVDEGGMIELEIPPQLGYGPDGFPPVIPANATLHFIIEVLDVQ